MATKLIKLGGIRGGYSSDPFAPPRLQTYQTAKDIDVFSQGGLLKPHIKLANDAGTTTTNQLANIIKIGTVYYAIGDDGTGKLRLFSTSALGSSTTWTTEGTSTTASTAPGTSGVNFLEAFDGAAYFWDASGVLSQYIKATDAYTQSWATSLGGRGPLMNHPGLKKLIIAAANKVYTYQSGAAPSAAALTLDGDYTINSLAPMGAFVLVGAEHSNGTSKIFVWDGSATTVDDMLDIQDVNLKAIRNVNGEIIAFVANQIGSRAVALRIYRWVNKAKQVIEIPIQATVDLDESPFLLDAAVDVIRGAAYFALRGKQAGSIGIDNLVYAYKDGVVTQARLNSVPTVADIAYLAVRAIDGDLVVIYRNDAATVWKMDHAQANATTGQLSANGTIETNWIRLNPFGKGRVVKMYIPHKPLAAGVGFTVKVKHLGAYPHGTSVPAADSYTTVGSQTTDNATYTILANEAQVFKICDYVSLQFLWDTVSGISAAEIGYPNIILEVEEISTF